MEKLEAEVWAQICKILEQPEVVLAELRRRKEEAVPFLARDVERIECEFRSTREQERRLVKFYQ